jgi:hypothetical protein
MTFFLCSILLALVVCISAEDPAACNCYLTSGTKPGYWTHHSFSDFRDLTPGLAPPVPESPNGTEDFTSPYFTSPAFANSWQIQSWTGKPQSSGEIDNAHSKANVYIRTSPPISGSFPNHSSQNKTPPVGRVT